MATPLEISSPSVRQSYPKNARDEDEFSVLDDTILDRNASPILSPFIKTRRDSTAESSQPLSADSVWSAEGYHSGNGAAGLPAALGSTFNHGCSQIFVGAASHSATAFQASSPWMFNEASGSCTPKPMPDQLSDLAKGRTEPSTIQQQALTPSVSTFDGDCSQAFQFSQAYPGSPQSIKCGWVSASSSDGLDLNRGQLPTRSRTPSFTNNNVLRRDGVRKKNARFEIPAERNLRTIDHLINQTNDEQEIKELKQQKRLLRNRQAALDSRQRKKQHTERLEEEKKHFTAVISELEDALGEMKMHEADWARAKDNWMASQQQYQHYIDNLMMEKEELVRRHTIETGELRKKNAILMEQLQRMDSQVTSTAPDPATFHSDFSEIEPLALNGWNEFSLGTEYSIEKEPHRQELVTAQAKTELQASSAQEPGKSTPHSSLLLMLLLCGAWVASRGSSTSTVALPKISDDMRVASATVLENIYRDSGVDFDNVSPIPQDLSLEARKTTEFRTREPKSDYTRSFTPRSQLDMLHHRLTAPSDRQLQVQAMSITPAEYNSLSYGGDFNEVKLDNSSPKESVSHVLASPAEAQNAGAAESYTRSLMYDKISVDVLKEFARMVAERNSGSNRNWEGNKAT